MSSDEAMRYLRVTLPDGDDVAMTIYEVDERDWVHRMIHLQPSGLLFAPEDVLLCFPVNVEGMLSRDCTETMVREDFELLWGELAADRRILAGIDASRACEGSIDAAHGRLRVRWQPNGGPGEGWTRVPGVPQLWVLGDAVSARSLCAALFVERTITWSSPASVVTQRRAAA